MPLRRRFNFNRQKKGDTEVSPFPGISGRGGGIRTRDPLHPMQVRYQAALRPERVANIIDAAS